jgi:hypothetical protein
MLENNMKTKILSLLMALTLVFMVSCSSWVDPNMNIDPTVPTDAPMSLILPTIEIGWAYILNGDIGRTSNCLTQQLAGLNAQQKDIYNYSLSPDDMNNVWNALYPDQMKNTRIMIEKAIAQNSPHYQGVGEVMMAFSLGTLTDLLGDIPYSEAFQGTKNLQPKYDKQEAIYASIDSLLTSAITHLSASTSLFSPSSDDVMYGGDLDKWIKAAYTLKARYYLHLKEFDKALAAAANGFTANADDMQVPFGTAATENNPLYQYVTQRAGDIGCGGKLIDLLNANTDPRLPMYGTVNDSSKYVEGCFPGTSYCLEASPVFFTSLAELQFIVAETKFYKGDKKGAYDAYIAGITASLDKHGVGNTDANAFLALPAIAVGETGITLELIMEQKYIAMFMNVESFMDYRRTLAPTLIPVKGTMVPRRLFYPDNELLYNEANVKSASDYEATNDFIYKNTWVLKKWVAK